MEWGLDEVSLFLNVCGIEDLVTHQRDNKFDGGVGSCDGRCDSDGNKR